MSVIYSYSNDIRDELYTVAVVSKILLVGGVGALAYGFGKRKNWIPYTGFAICACFFAILPVSEYRASFLTSIMEEEIERKELLMKFNSTCGSSN